MAKVFFREDEIRERLSISTLVFYQFRPLGEGSLKELSNHGIYRIELLESPEQYDMADPSSMRLVKELLDSHGIKVVAYHAHDTTFQDVDSEVKRIKRVDFCRRQIDTMLDLGGSVWGSHAGKAGATELKCYEELARYVEKTGAVVCVENFTGEGTAVERRVDFLDTLDNEHAGMILDIGHVRNDEGENPMTLPGGPSRVLRLCSRHLKHVHLHGFKDGRDHNPPLAQGDSIQWIELFSMLSEINYAGAINFEPSGEPTHVDTLRHVADFPKKIVEMAATHLP